jgi:hypothetical protein
MKKIYPVFIIGLMLMSGLLKAQTAQNWQPVFLGSPDGTNSLNGVEAYYTFATCNNSELILVELINHNNYTVKASWKNFIINNDGQKMSSSAAQDSVTIQSNSQLIGDCKGNNPSLVYKLTDFGTDKLNYKEYAVSGFDFVIIH